MSAQHSYVSHTRCKQLIVGCATQVHEVVWPRREVLVGGLWWLEVPALEPDLVPHLHRFHHLLGAPLVAPPHPVGGRSLDEW